MNCIVAIVGRPNVGKSTFFNRLVKQREAIVDAVSGVTRDRHYGKSYWNGKNFSLIDTGGYVVNSEDIFEKEIRKQVQLAIDQADIITFIMDVCDGITPMDTAVANLLRKVNKPVFFVINKVDNALRVHDAVEFYSLGIKEYYTISAVNGSGTGELLDAIAECIPEEKKINQGNDPKNPTPKFAIVGRPNVGKSSFINALVGEDRNIVTEVAGTTRDAIHTEYTQFGFNFQLIDTAGIRKKSKVSEDLEFYSVMRAVRAIEHCDVALVMIDATRGFEKQDQNIFWLAQKNRKGIVILVNKWDLIQKDNHTLRNFKKNVLKQIEPFTNVSIIFTSTLIKQRLLKALEAALEAFKNKTKRIATHKLNEAILPIIQKTPPASVKGKHIKIKYCTQLPTHTPQFAFFANLPQYIKAPYKRFIENKLRAIFDFKGAPITIYFRNK